MRIKNRQERLLRLWGRIDEQHNSLIAKYLRPQSCVLDIGAGYGSLIHYLTQLGHDAEGIDLDAGEVEIASQLFPGVRIEILNAEHLNEWRPPNFYDAVVLKDCLHHLIGEHNSDAVMVGLRHALKPGGQLIVLDPNPNWILRFARKLIRHHDPEAEFALAKKWVEDGPFVIRSIEYYEVVGLALSGGYVGIELVPAWPPLLDIIQWANHSLSQLVNTIGLGQHLCWRYVFWAEKLPD